MLLAYVKLTNSSSPSCIVNHSELLSCEDNTHKTSFAVYCGNCDGEEQYDFHWRRAQHGSDKDALRAFRGSEFEARLRRETITATRPHGVGGSLALLRRFKCVCIKRRKACECDCKICTLADVFLRRWHSARHGWRTSWRKAADGSLYRPPACTCFICGDAERSTLHHKVSSSMHSMMQVLLPCGKMEYAPYSLEGDTFKFYDGRCCYGKCPKMDAAAKARFLGQDEPKMCGWQNVFGNSFCPLEASSQPFSWQVWEPRLRGTNAEGKPSYSDELVPKHGTRAQFMTELRESLEAYLPHFWDHVLMQRGIKVHEAHKDSVTATIRSDYAAQIKTIRAHNATCASPESHNLCVTVVGGEPYEQLVAVRKRNGRPAHEKTVRKQKVSVFFGFHPAGVKPSARTFNVLREDVSRLLMTGKTHHGEWFHMGKRLPGRSTHPPLPTDLVDEATPKPIFPTVEREVDITDGCAAQFDGKDNYHQVAEWPTKVGTKRNHSILITMHGKNICDSLSNVVQSAIRWAVASEEILDPGTRALVLWLAKHKQVPTVAKVKKDGWWAVDNIYYGYFDPKLFTQLAVPTAKGFDGSSSKHRFVGVCMDPEKSRRDGPLQVSTAFCGCAKCCVFDFRDCLMKSVGGMATQMKQVTVPVVAASGAPSQSATLEEFAHELAAGQLRAVRVDSAEQGVEGNWWLCHILGPAIQASEQQVHATDLFEEGWWIVEIEWYEWQASTLPRKYKIKAGSRRWLAVNALVRVGGLAFEGGQRVPKSGLRVLNEPSRELIEDCV